MADSFNQVNAFYRSDLRELNELNFARFDAELEQELAEFRADLLERMSRLEVRFERRLDEQFRWLVGIWITVIGAAVALWFR